VAYADSAAESAPVPSQDAPKKKVLVLGTGWAGTSFLKNLDCSQYEVKVISPRNYFAFTPLLPSVTCGSVEARSIVEPIRRILEKVLLCQLILCYCVLNVIGRGVCLSPMNEPFGAQPSLLSISWVLPCVC
jgi:hypothetical protein